jgi:RNA polymerase sigma-70 factor, ECF subfamily
MGFDRMTEDTPISLLQRLSRQPNDEDWHRLVKIYSPLIHRWLCGFGIMQSDADDLVQDVFQTLLREITDFRHNGNSGAFRRWLRLTMVNRLRGFWRDRRTAVRLAGRDAETILVLMEDPSSDPNVAWDREHDHHVVNQLLELVKPQFAPSTWLAFQRQVLEECKASVVAAELGLSVNAALIAKSRVLQALRQEAQGLIEVDGLADRI